MTTTVKRKLRSGKTLWEAITPVTVRGAKAPRERFCDVAIVGGGISGALTAHALSKQGINVVLFDRRMPGAGSTSASTALIQWEIDEALGALVKKVGRARAVASYKATFEAVRKLGSLIASSGIDCDYKKRETLLIAGNTMKSRALKAETALRKRIGLPSTFLDRAALRSQFGFDRDGAILSNGSCELDPRKLTKHLLLGAQRSGVEIVVGRTVTDISASPHGVFLKLDSGDVIAASKVIAATGYETLPQLPKDKYQLISTWALATERVPEAAKWARCALVWEAADPYLYFRTTADNRIIVGGEDAEYVDVERRDAQTAKKTDIILDKLGKLLPDVKLKAAYRWAGTFAASPTGLPVIGELEALPNVFAILGSGGNGITFSVIASEIAAAWVAGKSHRHAALFAPEA